MEDVRHDVRALAYARQAIKNLFMEPATSGYPFVPAEYPERMRGHVELVPADCIGCGLCMRSCPPGAIRVDRPGKTWTINRFDCVQCGSCVNACPKKCLHMAVGYTEPCGEKKEETHAILQQDGSAAPAPQTSAAQKKE